MPTKKKIIAIVCDDVTYEHFNEFKWLNRFKSESAAGLLLLHAGMNALKDEYPELDMNAKVETGEKQNLLKMKKADFKPTFSKSSKNEIR